MTMTKQVAQVRISGQVRELERAINYALGCAASLTASAATARNDLDAGPALGLKALTWLASVQAGLVKAGGDTARAHGDLLGAAREMGIADENCDWIKPGAQLETVEAA